MADNDPASISRPGFDRSAIIVVVQVELLVLKYNAKIAPFLIYHGQLQDFSRDLGRILRPIACRLLPAPL